MIPNAELGLSLSWKGTLTDQNAVAIGIQTTGLTLSTADIKELHSYLSIIEF